MHIYIKNIHLYSVYIHTQNINNIKCTINTNQYNGAVTARADSHPENYRSGQIPPRTISILGHLRGDLSPWYLLRGVFHDKLYLSSTVSDTKLYTKTVLPKIAFYSDTKVLEIYASSDCFFIVLDILYQIYCKPRFLNKYCVFVFYNSSHTSYSAERTSVVIIETWSC